MNAWRWAAVVMCGLNALAEIYRVGKVRKIKTPEEAIANVIEWGIIITLIIL